ncbi:MAG: hypothetical protein EBX50_22090, partial [Chitinophagia bacterium]|nr:hypothetical protein [Chitinophagia bacterium]
LKGYAINNRMNRFENQLEGLSNQVNQIEVQIKTKDLPVQGIFMDGQVFDAYLFKSIQEVNALAFEWQIEYNKNHPHKSLNGQSPWLFRTNFG